MKSSFQKSLKCEMQDIAKGCSGALIFGLPMLYTMEIWFEGKNLNPQFLLFLIIAMILVNMLLTYIAGFHKRKVKVKFDAFMESISSCGMGIVLSALILWLIGSITSLSGINLGLILVEGLIMSLGISIANLKFNSNEDVSKGFSLSSSFFKRASPRKTLGQEIAASTVGALFFALNVAPTEEVIFIATRISATKLLLLLIAQVFMSYVILSVLSKKKGKRDEFFQKPIIHAFHTAAIAIIVSGILILTLGYNNPEIHSNVFIPLVIVLSLPGVIGASAGRLIL